MAKTGSHIEIGLTRRQFLKSSALLGIGLVGTSPWTPSHADGPLNPGTYHQILADVQNAPLAMYGVHQGASSGELEKAILAAAEAATDFSWLKPGDRVFIKPASNSPNPFPATTHPAAIRTVSRLLKDHGAGKILVGDQAGVQHVHPCRDKTRGSTRAVMMKNGLFREIEPGGAEPYLFEEAGYDAFFPAEPPQGSHWREPILLPTVLKEVDHVIYLPRISTHMVAGITLAAKIAVGWLREDSRLELHRDAKTFHEKAAEINGAPEIRRKLRLILSVGNSAQTTWGPDFGYEALPEYGLVVASENLATHDLLATAYLNLLKKDNTPWTQKGLEGSWWGASVFNRSLVTLFWSPGQGLRTEHLPSADFENPWIHPTTVRSMEIFGKPVQRPTLINVGETVPPSLIHKLEQQVFLTV